MTTATVAERTLLIDDKTGTPADFSGPLVGGLGDLGKMVDAAQEITNATDTRPQKKYTGFVIPQGFTLTFEADIGGSPDPVDQLYVNRRTANPRTVKITWNTTGTTWSFAIECYIVGAKPITEPGESGLGLIEVEFAPTGTETIVYS